jgi:hypothetical protein
MKQTDKTKTKEKRQASPYPTHAQVTKARALRGDGP